VHAARQRAGIDETRLAEPPNESQEGSSSRRRRGRASFLRQIAKRIPS
jgi:hypothetical protein